MSPASPSHTPGSLTPASFRAVYKHVETQEIDVDIYLPPLHDISSKKCPVVINIHGGAFMLGSSKMINKDQAPITVFALKLIYSKAQYKTVGTSWRGSTKKDSQQLFATWLGQVSPQILITSLLSAPLQVDTSHFVWYVESLRVHTMKSTADEATVAHCQQGFGVPRPVAGIYDMYGACNFDDGFWSTKLPNMKLPPDLTDSFINKVFDEHPVATTGGVSLEGQASGPPDFSDPRQAYALTQVANGTVLDAIFPSKDWGRVDPALNISPSFPPTFIVHGTDDNKIPIQLSKNLFEILRMNGVNCGMVELPGEEHTFAAKMEVGSVTWQLQRQGFNFLESLIQQGH
ncbi:hypothetical protein NM208_g4890 [Fusarium decemcellulare]|uniref:Uncharacterized protein n=1 Tax=Fusarium decemcellulare TaxID=57161 RepID=A0ACC1SJ22_9HYPO|nr:hypothetical protein NM208_g4890 [Fusarium decemcellulare]